MSDQSNSHRHTHESTARFAGVRRGFLVLMAALALIVGAAACSQSDSDDDNTSTVSPSTSESSSTSSSPSPSTSTPSSSSSSSSASAASACTTDQLKASVTQGDGGAAGSQLPYIVFTNNGTACTMQGFAGVSLTKSGKQIGASAGWANRDQVAPVTLEPGGTAHLQLQIVQAGNYDASVCGPTQADAILVYPPEQKGAISVATTGYTGCSNASVRLLTAGPVQQGS